MTTIAEPNYLNEPLLDQVEGARRRLNLKLVFLGDTAVGKSSLVRCITNEHFKEDLRPTIGADFTTKQLFVEGTDVILEAWDTAGHERFRSLTSQFYRDADMCCLVFDVHSKRSFESLGKWINEFRLMCDDNDFPILVIGNKIDINEDTMIIPEGRVKEWCHSHGGLTYAFVSAKTGENIDQSIMNMVKKAMKRKQGHLDRWTTMSAANYGSTSNTNDNVKLPFMKTTMRKARNFCCC